MLSPNFTPFPQLATSRLLLRRVRVDDAGEISFLRSDETILQYLGRAPAASMKEAEAFILKIRGLEDNNNGITWAITLKQDDTLIGTICYWNITKEHSRSEIGYALHPDLQRRGIMQEAMEEVLKYGFNSMGLHSVEAKVDPRNLPSIRLLERNHFLREGLFKEDYFYNGEFLDTAVYSLLRSQHIPLKNMSGSKK